MTPIAVVEECPKFVLGQVFEIGDDVDGDQWRLLVQERLRKVMVINDVVAPFGPDDRRNDVTPQHFSPAALSASRHWRRLISTSRKPTVICVGRSSATGTPIGSGSDIWFLLLKNRGLQHTQRLF